MFDIKHVKNRQISRRKVMLGAVAASAVSAPVASLIDAGTARAQSTLQFATISSLAASPSTVSTTGVSNLQTADNSYALADQQVAMVANYASSTDLGGGTFVWNANSSAAHDGGVVICPADRLASVDNIFLHSCNGIGQGYAGTFTHKSVQPNTVTIYAGSVTAQDNGSGTLFGLGVYGTINYTTGAWSLIYVVPPPSSVSITANYQYAASPGRWIRQLSSTMNLDAFGLDGFGAWYIAFNTATRGGYSVLEVSTGIYNINRAAFAGTGTMLVVPDGLTIQLDAGAQVNFDYIEAPLFSFLGNTSGGMSGGIFRYTGGTPNYLNPAITKTQFFNYPGIAGKGLTTGQGCDVYALVYSNSSNMLFTGWDVASATPNNETNILPTILYMHPTAHTVAATNNTVSNMTWRDFQQGWLGFGQSGMTINGINADRRAGLHLMNGSAAYGPGPGHLMYPADTTSMGGLLMVNCTIQNILDGPNPINYGVNWLYNGHTLSPKSIGAACVFNGVVSQHPVGIWSGVGLANCIVKNFTWQTLDSSFYALDYGFVISSSGQTRPGNNNIFSNFTVNVPNKPFSLAADSGIQFNNNQISDFNVTCNNALLTSNGIFDFNGSDNTFNNIIITPTVSDGGKGMVAVVLRGATNTGNSGSITVLGSNAGTQILRCACNANPAAYPNNLTVNS